MITPSFPIYIGDVPINGGVVLGPMAGITNVAYRRFNKPFGVALSYSEMISDCGLAYGNKRTFDYLATSKDEHPVGLQLFGSNIEATKKAIGIMEEHADYDILDINLGCPVHKVTKTGAGSAFLGRPNELFDYMSEVCRVSHKPVTAKIRLGIDEKHINVYEIADLLEKAGIKALSVHARTKAQMYEGEADYTKLKDLGEKLSIPLIISGDIYSIAKAKEAIETTKASMVMVARGGLGNPFLITQLDKYLKGEEVPPSPSPLEQLGYAKEYSRMLIEEVGEHRATLLLRGILPHFFKGSPGFKKIRNDLAQNLSSTQQLEAFYLALEKRLKTLS